MRLQQITLKDMVEKFRKQLLKKYPLTETESIIRLIFHDVFHYEFKDIFLNYDKLVSTDKQLRLDRIIRDLMKCKPVQYILGYTEFCELTLEVNENVLIPRRETEELVLWIIADCNDLKNQSGLNILDIGTGSGCIAIALAKKIPDSHVTGIDVSEKSLEVAIKNSATNNVVVNFIAQDILVNALWEQSQKYDIIISNPPYVCDSERKNMPQNVVDYEPSSSLFVPDKNPLLFYDAIADFAKLKLSAKGKLYFEVNESLGKEIMEMLKKKDFVNIELKKDMQGKDRMISATKV